MNINKVEYIAEITFLILTCFGIIGPAYTMYQWYRARIDRCKIVKVLGIIVGVILQCLWFYYLWFMWLPITVLCILILICIEIKYHKKLYLSYGVDKHDSK